MKTITTHGNISRQPFSKISVWHFINALFLLVYCPAHSQEKVKTITGEFDGKQITGLDNHSVNRLSNYLIHLNGANSAQYKVVFQFDDFEWNSEPPSVITTILPNIITLSSDMKTLTNPNKILRELSQDSTKALDIKTKIKIIIQRINLIIQTADHFPDSINDKNTAAITTFAKGQLSPILKLEELRCQNDSLCLAYDTLFSKFQYNVAYIIGFYEALKEFNAQSSSGDYEYVEELASIKPIYDILKAKNYLRLLKIIITCAKNEPKNYAESDIHFPDKEVTNLKIFVLNKFDLTDTICTYSTDIYRTGVFKLDFSTGIGVNSLIKPTYYLGNNGSSYINKENGRDADLSVMALLHANWRVKRNFCIGPVAGVSVSTFDANTGFVLGLGTSFGTKNTISLSAGGIMGKSYKLSSRVSSDGNAADIPLESTISEIPKVDAVNYGWFVSLTYNLTRTKKKE